MKRTFFKTKRHGLTVLTDSQRNVHFYLFWTHVKANNILKRKYSQAEKILKSKNISIENNAERISCEIKKLLLEL